MNGDFVCRKFAWGPDLSSSLEGAGGIGGLLAIEDPNDPNDGTDVVGSFLVCYDGNGNVTQLIDWPAAQTAGSIDPNHVVAHYEYSPFGRVSRASGTYAWDNPFRFSTKWFDNETGLGYWGYRYYSPDLGRWINRDPLEEAGGVNLYNYASNIPIILIDKLGQLPSSCGLSYSIGSGSFKYPTSPIKVCCYYRRHSNNAAGISPNPVPNKRNVAYYRETNRCRKSLLDTCRCQIGDPVKKNAAGRSYAHKLFAATAGPCCFCTVRVSGWSIFKKGPWAHAWLVIECPGRSANVDFSPDDVGGALPFIPTPGSKIPRHGTPPDDGQLSKLNSIQVDCDTGNKMIDWLIGYFGEIENSAGSYNWPINQCRTFAQDVLNEIRSRANTVYEPL